MNLENIEEARSLMDKLERHEGRLERLERRVYSILFTDGSQKSNREVWTEEDDTDGCVILTINPGDADWYGDESLGKLGTMIVENTKKVIRAEIERIKEKLSTL